MLVTMICIVTIAAQDTVFKEPEWRNVLVAGDLRGKKMPFSIIYLVSSYTTQPNLFYKLWKLYSCCNDLVISPNALKHDIISKPFHKV